MTEKRGKKRKGSDLASDSSKSGSEKSSKHKSSKHKKHKSSKHKKHKKKSSRKKKGSGSRHKKHPRKKKALRESEKVEKEIEEEFFVPGPKHKGKFKIPLGIKFLIGYLVFILILYVTSFAIGISFPTTILFGKLVTGSEATIFNLVLIALIVFMIYGFWTRKWYTFDLAVGFFAFSALNSFLSLTLFEAETTAFRKLMMLSFVSLMFMNVVVVWYIIHERKFFFAKTFHDRPVKERDKVFLYTIVTFWVVALLIGSTLGVQFYKESKLMVDKAVEDLQGNLQHGMSVCESESGAQRDVCYLVLATAMSVHGDENPVRMCENIESDFYRFACARSAQVTG